MMWQMTIKSERVYNTWQIHLGGLLAFLGSSTSCIAGMKDGLSSMISNEANDSHISIASSLARPVCSTLIRLYRLAPELDSIFSGTHQPRKLDVQKLRVAIKAIHKDSQIALRLFKIPTTISESILACSIINSLRSILLLTSKFLLRSGDHLHGAKSNTWEDSREFGALKITIDHAVSEIADTATQALDADIASYPPKSPDVGPCSSSIKTITGLLHLWPLCTAMTAPGITHQQVLCFRQVLSNLGEVACLPRATALVSLVSKTSTDRFS